MSKTTPKKKTTTKKKESGKKTKTPKPSLDESPPDVETSATSGDTSISNETESSSVPQKPLSREELIFKKFESPYTPSKIPGPISRPDFPIAPPFVSYDNEEENQRIKSVMFRKFDFQEAAVSYEKAEAERIAAEKAEAERIEAERIAAEKAEAERIEAERIAAEKAEAERVAAEKARAEAERIAAEKARAEKAKAELEAMKAAQAQEKLSSVTYDQPKIKKKEDVMDKSIKLAAGGILGLFLLLAIVSYCNTGNYYVRSVSDGIQIFQGRFSPVGEKLLITLPGVSMPESKAIRYTKTEIYPLICNFFLQQADHLIMTANHLTLDRIRAIMNQAAPYAITPEHREAVRIRLHGMDQMIELYKADVLISMKTPESYQAAKDLLISARSRVANGQSEYIDKKLAWIEETMDPLKTR